MADHGPVPKGAKVLAWAEGRTSSISPPLVIKSLKAHFVADIGDGGEFEFKNLGSTNRYGLTVFGGGAISVQSDEIRNQLAPASDLTLRARYLAGAVIHFARSPPQLSQVLSQICKGYSHESATALFEIDVDMPVGAVYAMPREWAVRLGEFAQQAHDLQILPRPIFVVVQKPSEAPCNGRMKITLPFLGTKSINFKVELLTNGSELPLVVVELGSTDIKTGSLEIAVPHGLELPDVGDPNLPHKALLEYSTGGESGALHLRAERSQSGAFLTVASVPVGTARLRVTAPSTDFVFPNRSLSALEVTIEEGKTTFVDLPGDLAGSLALSIRNRDGFPSTARLVAELYRQDGDRYRIVGRSARLFGAPPYCWELLPPGPLFLRIRDQEFVGQGAFIPFNIDGGEITRLALVESN